jgi:hypothetical protein
MAHGGSWIPTAAGNLVGGDWPRLGMDANLGGPRHPVDFEVRKDDLAALKTGQNRPYEAVKVLRGQ